MPLCTTAAMLRNAQEKGYAVAAFNTENMEMAQAIVAAAEELCAPVILQTTPGTLRYAPPAVFAGLIAALAAESFVPVALHLDHGDGIALASKALRAGYTSVMIDGSHAPLEENIRITKAVVDICRPNGVPVEAELGRVGGKEDDLESEGPGYVDPDEAVRFVGETGANSLAIGIGTVHGIYAVAPVLNIPLVSVIAGRVPIPLVLHGASGLGDREIQDCIAGGICKVNFATELRQAYTAAVREALEKDAALFDPKKYGGPGGLAVQKQVMERMRICGCEGKAD